jgi:hypothetical protein
MACLFLPLPAGKPLPSPERRIGGIGGEVFRILAPRQTRKGNAKGLPKRKSPAKDTIPGQGRGRRMASGRIVVPENRFIFSYL